MVKAAKDGEIMTFSILARDPETGQLGGAAATGSLCVGGWVLRGDPRAGMSACQGAAPSSLWGEETLIAMKGGGSAADVVAAVISPDPGREWRQLAVLDLNGSTAAWTGDCNNDWKGDLHFANGVVAGNILAGPNVLRAMIDGFQQADGPLHARLMAALRGADAAGGDTRALQSAAMLVVGRDIAPLTLRIDLSDDPLAALDVLRQRATRGDYANWAAQTPCLADPFRVLTDRTQ